MNNLSANLILLFLVELLLLYQLLFQIGIEFYIIITFKKANMGVLI